MHAMPDLYFLKQFQTALVCNKYVPNIYDNCKRYGWLTIQSYVKQVYGAKLFFWFPSSTSVESKVILLVS